MTSELHGEAPRNQGKSRSRLLYLVAILGVLCLGLTGILVMMVLRSPHGESAVPMHQITIGVEGEETIFGTGTDLSDITQSPMSSAKLVVTSSSKKRYSGPVELPYTLKFNESSGSTILVAAQVEGSFDKPGSSGSISCKISIDGIPLASQSDELGVTSEGGRSALAKCEATVP